MEEHCLQYLLYNPLVSVVVLCILSSPQHGCALPGVVLPVNAACSLRQQLQ
jgi:hypothetical protein